MAISEDVLFPEHSWEKTQPDMQAVKEDDTAQIPVIEEEFFEGARHSKPGVSSLVLSAIGVAAGLVLSFVGGYLIHTTPPAEHPTNVTTSLLPAPTATRTRTLRVPGPVVTRRLRSTVTARATRTVPGPRVTVTETSPVVSGPTEHQ